MVDVGHAIDHTGIVLPEYGGNAFSRKFLQESLTGGLSLQGGSDSFLRLYGYGMSGNSLFAFHKFLLECLVAYAFTDLAGFDGYAGPFSFFIGSRMEVCRNARCTSFFVHHYTNLFTFFKLRSFEDFFDLCVPSI